MSLQKTLSQKIAAIENRISKDQAELAAYKLVLAAEAPATEVSASPVPANPVTPISQPVAAPVKRRGRPAANKTVEAKPAEVNGVASHAPVAPAKPAKKAKRELSPEARASIAAAQTKRWAAVKRAKKKAAKEAAKAAAPKETAEQFDEYSQVPPVNGVAHEAA